MLCTGETKWWDGYEGQLGILIDDYNAAWPITYLLKVLHEHEHRVEVKGSTAQLRAKFIVITSNKHPDEWYPNADLNQKAALKRRITRFEWMDVPYGVIKDEPMDSRVVIDLDSDEDE